MPTPQGNKALVKPCFLDGVALGGYPQIPLVLFVINAIFITPKDPPHTQVVNRIPVALSGFLDLLLIHKIKWPKSVGDYHPKFFGSVSSNLILGVSKMSKRYFPCWGKSMNCHFLIYRCEDIWTQERHRISSHKSNLSPENDWRNKVRGYINTVDGGNPAPPGM